VSRAAAPARPSTGSGSPRSSGDVLPSPPLPRRLRRQLRTVEIMIRMYCRRHHRRADPRPAGHGEPCAGGLCAECAALLDYSESRVAACSFGEQKPVCSTCFVHCFRPAQREQIRTVMRYSGPRMTPRHPCLAVRHLLERHQASSAG
jgi:hypothetical protein